MRPKANSTCAQNRRAHRADLIGDQRHHVLLHLPRGRHRHLEIGIAARPRDGGAPPDARAVSPGTIKVETPAPPRPEPPLPPALQSPRELGPRVPDDPALVDRDEPPRPRSGNLRGLVAASGTLGLGLFPNPSPGFELGLGLARRSPARRVGLHVELAGGADFAGRFRAAGVDAGGDLLAGHGALRTCATPAWRRVELRACGRVGAGVLQARGVGVVSPVQIRQPWIFAGAELGLAITLHRNVALVFELGAAGNLLRPHVWIREPAADYVMPAPSGRSRLGLEVRFP